MRWIIFIAIYFAIDVYSFQALKTITNNRIIHGLWLLISVAILGLVIYQLSFAGSSRTMNAARMYTFGFFLAVFVPKLLLIIILFGEDIVRLFVGLFAKVGGNETGFYMPSRRKFISAMALGVAAIPFASLLYGMYRGKYNYKVLKYALEFEDLPEAFHGYTLTQISDVHSGSFDNRDKIAYGVDLINAQQSDVILFTGDLVNNIADEMLPWKELFGSLNARDGVYSVLGNHDYGDYVNWDSQSEQQQNLNTLKELQREMGWKLLLNEHVNLERNGQSVKLIGVENWGAGGFKKAGDLDKACEGLSAADFKILMSHDPSH